MFGDFTFSSGFSQLANLDISQKFEQLKKDLESNISSAIDQDALSALTGEGAKAVTEEGPTNSHIATGSKPEPGTPLAPLDTQGHEEPQSASLSQSQQEQEVSSTSQQAIPEADSSSPLAALSPRQRSLRHPKSPRSPAAQRRVNARSKPDAAGNLGIRRLGAEPIGRKVSFNSREPLPVPQSDDAESQKAGSSPGSVPTAQENGDQQSMAQESSKALAQHETELPSSDNGVATAPGDGIRIDADAETDGWEGDVEDSAGQRHTTAHKNMGSSRLAEQSPADEQQLQERRAPSNSTAAELPASVAEHEGSDSTPNDQAPQQAAEDPGGSAGPQQLEAGMQLGSIRGASTSSVEKPGTPPRMASPKAPQPATSAATDEAGSSPPDLPSSPFENESASVDLPQAQSVNIPQQELPSISQNASDLRSLPANASAHARPQQEIASLDLEAARQLIIKLQASLEARELQLERKLEEVASMQDTTQQVMAKNEELARKSAAISEEDLNAMRTEFEARLGAADRKVYALTKERDALRRGADRLNSAHDLVMEEGERLSKKQLAQENTIKKLRVELAELRNEKGSASASLSAERQKVESAQAAKQKAEEQLASLRQSQKAELEAGNSHYETLLQKARSAQVEAEQAARAAAKEGLGRKLREAEARAESLAETVDELRAGLDRQRAAADYREDALKRELADITRRGQAAEARHEELASALPEATQPLLRQIEAMQAAAAAHSDAWAAAERSLHERLSAAEAQAAASGERERAANERAKGATSRQAALLATLDAAREESSEARGQAEDAQRALLDAQQRVRRLEEQLRKVQAQCSEAVAAKDSAEAAAHELRSMGEQSAMTALAAAEARCADLEERLRSAQAASPADALTQLGQAAQDSAGNGPPAMAGPGCRWVLVKEGEEAPSSASARQSADREAQAVRRAGSYSSQLDMALGPSGEGTRLQEMMKQRDEQIDALQQQIMDLERTRDSLAEELVTAAQAVESGKAVERKFSSMQAEYSRAVERLRSATELLGEKDERMAELAADVADMRQLYREQVEVFVEQLGRASQQNTPQPSPRPQTSVAEPEGALDDLQ